MLLSFLAGTPPTEAATSSTAPQEADESADAGPERAGTSTPPKETEEVMDELSVRRGAAPPPKEGDDNDEVKIPTSAETAFKQQQAVMNAGNSVAEAAARNGAIQQKQQTIANRSVLGIRRTSSKAQEAMRDLIQSAIDEERRKADAAKEEKARLQAQAESFEQQIKATLEGTKAKQAALAAQQVALAAKSQWENTTGRQRLDVCCDRWSRLGTHT